MPDLHDIADEPRDMTVDEALEAAGVTPNIFDPDIGEPMHRQEYDTPDGWMAVETMGGDVTLIAVPDSEHAMLTDKAEVGRRLQAAHREVEDLVTMKLGLFERLRESRERLALIARAARIYGIEAPASTPDTGDDN